MIYTQRRREKLVADAKKCNPILLLRLSKTIGLSKIDEIANCIVDLTFLFRLNKYERQYYWYNKV